MEPTKSGADAAKHRHSLTEIEAGIAAICTHYRVAIIAPTTTLTMFDLAAKGAALAIDALPAFGDGNEARSLTQPTKRW